MSHLANARCLDSSLVLQEEEEERIATSRGSEKPCLYAARGQINCRILFLKSSIFQLLCSMRKMCSKSSPWKQISEKVSFCGQETLAQCGEKNKTKRESVAFSCVVKSIRLKLTWLQLMDRIRFLPYYRATKAQHWSIIIEQNGQSFCVPGGFFSFFPPPNPKT